jgi:hypothetical protein
MRYLILLVIFGTSIAYGQTKEETIDWLNQKFRECKSINWVNLAVQNNTTDGEFLTILNHYGSFANAYNMKADNIKAVKVYRAEAGNYNIRLIGNTIVEIEYKFNENRDAKEVSKKNLNEINLVLDANSSDAEKLKKGLTHLINLLGGNLIKKDLFED